MKIAGCRRRQTMNYWHLIGLFLGAVLDIPGIFACSSINEGRILNL